MTPSGVIVLLLKVINMKAIKVIALTFIIVGYAVAAYAAHLASPTACNIKGECITQVPKTLCILDSCISDE